jgi:hypothetical protein
MKHIIQLIIILFLTAGWSANVLAQTEMDAIMMNKKQFCNGPAYMYSSWDHYW